MINTECTRCRENIIKMKLGYQSKVTRDIGNCCHCKQPTKRVIIYSESGKFIKYLSIPIDHLEKYL